MNKWQSSRKSNGKSVSSAVRSGKSSGTKKNPIGNTSPVPTIGTNKWNKPMKPIKKSSSTSKSVKPKGNSSRAGVTKTVPTLSPRKGKRPKQTSVTVYRFAEGIIHFFTLNLRSLRNLFKTPGSKATTKTYMLSRLNRPKSTGANGTISYSTSSEEFNRALYPSKKPVNWSDRLFAYVALISLDAGFIYYVRDVWAILFCLSATALITKNFKS